MKVLYFAWLRAKTGIGEEEIDPPAEVADVAGLIEWLKARGPGHQEAFKDLGVVRCAINQDYVPLSHPVKRGDEVAFFPPVTGG
ncbi:molybdopterin converting factor subunit 1 [Telmatospirillum sp. J64-1]|uniref:molybdopterin converting factor subunit 1 n=1 Tax=Telmatospirillum sp. J64-1 TaxID=2502183 RepID=UPI00115F0177|nr:molybdopterin converting factor subunit 1 [Telmatospirillum sp. J64-1]